ncbi:MAG: hypothetical protein WD830_05600 [Chloroflexota bacterium]
MSLILLAVIWVTMWRWGAAYYNLMQDTAERAIAAKDTVDGAATLAEFERARLAWHPFAMTIVGLVGVAVILWLMIFRPF